jgi:glucose/arabinose dehydrogenase
LSFIGLTLVAAATAVDLPLELADGSLLVSDDRAKVLYRIRYRRE